MWYLIKKINKKNARGFQACTGHSNYGQLRDVIIFYIYCVINKQSNSQI